MVGKENKVSIFFYLFGVNIVLFYSEKELFIFLIRVELLKYFGIESFECKLG